MPSEAELHCFCNNLFRCYSLKHLYIVKWYLMIGRKAVQLNTNKLGGIRAVKEQYGVRLQVYKKQTTQNLIGHF